MVSSADSIIVFLRKVLLGEQTFVITPAISMTNNRRANHIDAMDEYGRYSFAIEKTDSVILITNLLADTVEGRGLKTYALFEDVFQRLHHSTGKRVAVSMLVGKRQDLHDWFTERKYTLVSKGGITYAQNTF